MNTQTEQLADWANRMQGSSTPEPQAQPQEQEQVNEPIQEPQAEEIAEVEETQEQPQETEAPTQEEVNNEVSTEEPNQETEEEVYDDSWLNDSTEKTTTEEPKEGNFEMYSEIAEVLGVESFGDKDTVINHLKELNETKANLEKELALAKEETPFANDEIKKANELAKSGGDFKKYLELSSVDYGAIDDDTLLTELVAKPNLGENPEVINEWLGGLTPAQKQFEANRVRQQLTERDNAQKQAILDEARKRKESMDNGIKEVLKKSDNLFGLKMTPAMKKKSFENLTSEKGLFSHILGKDGSIDHKKAVEAEFILSNFKDIVKTALTNERNKVKAEEFKETTRPNMNQQRGSTSAPKKKEGTPLENWLDSMRNQTYKGK